MASPQSKSLPKINGLIFKELLMRGYSLDGKTRIWDIADSKLWYLTPAQAQAYLNFQDSENYKNKIGPKEITLIKKKIDDILERIGDKEPLNIIDLGCGDGKKAVIFIEKLKGKAKIRYCPIDISGYMVCKAIEKISKLKVEEVMEFQYNISDFENLENITPLLKKGDFKRNFFLLLGNTLGNFEIHELLYEVRRSMKEGDFLIIGNGLDNGKVEEDVIKACKENRYNNEFLILIPLQLGLERNELQLGARFRNSRIEFYYTILTDKTIEFQGKKVHFNKGDQIIVAIAYHYQKDDLMSYLKMYFGNVDLFASGDGSYALALCKK